MIQDILPKHLDNQYKNVGPRPEDIVFMFEGSSVLGRINDGEVEYPDYGTFVKNADKAEGYNYIYLLSVDEERYFLAMPEDEVQIGQFWGEMADSKVHNEYEIPVNGFEFIGVDMFRKAMPKYRAFAAITAYHLYSWYRDTKYCGRCGAKLIHDGKERMMRCESCGNVAYPKISPAVIVAVTNGTKLLLTKYAGRTYKNYALIAGFNEIGETFEETVRREVMEEVGLKVKNIHYYKSQPWALSGSLLAGFYCELDGDESIHLQEDELSVGKWVDINEIDFEDDGISLTREMILHFKDMLYNKL